MPLDELTPATTRGAARRDLAALFRKAGIASADLDARVLLCAACGLDHAALTRDPEASLGPAVSILRGYVERRLAHEPVSRILGRREFWGMPFAIGPAVLDPRPETEGLVGSVLDAIGGRRDAPLRLLDLGAGSGAILCACLHELPQASGVGIDRSFEACRVARGNIAALGLSFRGFVICGTWADALGTRYDVILSNPPYIPHADVVGLDPDVRDYDPPLALDGGADGLDAYRAIVPTFDALLHPGGVVAVECGWDQGPAVSALMRDAGLGGVSVYRDIAGLDRVVLGLKAERGATVWRPRNTGIGFDGR